MFKARKPIGHRPWAALPAKWHSPLARLVMRVTKTEEWRPSSSFEFRRIYSARLLGYDITKPIVPRRLRVRLLVVRGRVHRPPDVSLDHANHLGLLLCQHCVR